MGNPVGTSASRDTACQGLRRIGADWLYGGLIALGAAVAIWPFWQPGISSGNDMLVAIYRAFELGESWKYGLWYPRLGMGLDFTYGGPLFHYYAPLVSYGILLFHLAGLGLVEATKAVCTLNLLVAGVGAYLYGRWLLGERRAALVSGLVYVFSPYLLLDLYERGAISEMTALALVPWAFWTACRALCEGRRPWLWGTATSVALVALVHNVTLLFLMPVLAVYMALLGWRRRVLARLPRVGLAVALGLGMSAFYWLPALVERGYVSFEDTMLMIPALLRQHLAPLGGVVQPGFFFDYYGPLRFRFALGQALLGACGVLGMAFQTRRLRHDLAVLTGMLGILFVLQFPFCQPFWEGVPLARFILFPWRLYGFASFFMALLIGSLLRIRWLAGRQGWVAAGVVLVLSTAASLRNLSPSLSPEWYQFSSDQVGYADLFERARFGFPLFGDYKPRWVPEPSMGLAQPRPAGAPTLPPLASVPRVEVVEEQPDRLTLQVRSQEPAVLRLHRIFFPGWQAYVDGERVPTLASGHFALVTAAVPVGDHRVSVRFEETPLRRASDLLALVAFVAWAGWATLSKEERRVFIILVLVLAVGAGLAKRQEGGFPKRPVAYHVNFQDEIHLVGYHLDRTTWEPGEILTLRLYWWVQRTPARDYKVFLHLVTPDDSARVAQADRAPILGYGPTTRWEPGELVVDEHPMLLGNDIAPGAYTLLVGMYLEDTMQNLSVLGAPEIWPGDRVPLATVEVRERGAWGR